MTCAETTVGQTIGRLLGEHPDLDPSADGALDNLGQFHIGGADAVVEQAGFAATEYCSSRPRRAGPASDPEPGHSGTMM